MSKSRPPTDDFAGALLALGAWFERQKRILPWRNDPSLYRVWISEIMLQQTQVVTVVPYFERFLAVFPDVGKLAEASEAQVLLNWAGLGYYSRARNILRSARQIVAAGGFPESLEGWLELPGVGRYTAGAILSIALNQPLPILDGNVERVLSRVRRVDRKSGDTVYKDTLWQHSQDFVEQAAANQVPPRTLNQALMELGATVCTPKRPRCLVCPLAAICEANALNEQEAYPARKAPKKWLKVKEEFDCLIDSRARVLVRKRQPKEWRAGLWDLPEREKGVGPAKLLKAHAVLIGEVVTKHIVTRHKIERTTRVWKLKGKARRLLKAAALQVNEGKQGTRRWVSLAKPEVPVGSALTRTINQVCARFPEVLPVK